MSVGGQTVSNSLAGGNRECESVPLIVVQAIPQAFSVVWKTSPDTPFWLPNEKIGENAEDNAKLIAALHLMAADAKSTEPLLVNIDKEWFDEQPFVEKPEVNTPEANTEDAKTS